MPQISGTLNAYFPFELKGERGIRQISSMCDRIRDYQIKQLRHSYQPRTDLMDKVAFRRQIEEVLINGQKLMGEEIEPSCAPYATSHIAQSFHQSREDNLFAKVASVLVSRFDVICPGVNDDKRPMEGALYYFNNFGNRVGTYIIAVRFMNRTVDEVLRLKHYFYKRALAQISEWTSCYDNYERNISIEREFISFQNYICRKSIPQSYRRKTDIDFRARYTFLEIEDYEQVLSNQDIFGLLCANEKYPYSVIEGDRPKDYSNDLTYSLYLNLRSALLVNKERHQIIELRQNHFFEQLQFDRNDIDLEILEPDELIAGLGKCKFPTFLKAVELHLLTNNAQRHETVRHTRSYFRPFIMLNRRYKLWQILNDLDAHNSFISPDMNESFGVNENLSRLKEEYLQLTNHLINYLMLFISLFAFVATLISLTYKL